jgi:hypothetical protein
MTLVPAARVASALIVLSAFVGLAGCRSTEKSEPAPAALVLPDSAKPDAKLAPLAFMTGSWVCVNPNKTVNEEHWMPARGSVMIGTFRQVRRDGKCAFVEVSQIALDGDEIVLRLRHLHAQLEVPAERAAISLFKIKSIAPNRVEFVGTGDAEGVLGVVYERVNATTLTQTVSFDPAKSKEKPFTSTYTRQ